MQGKIKVFFERRESLGKKRKGEETGYLECKSYFGHYLYPPFYIPSYPAAAFWLAIASSEFQEEREGEKEREKEGNIRC